MAKGVDPREAMKLVTCCLISLLIVVIASGQSQQSPAKATDSLDPEEEQQVQKLAGEFIRRMLRSLSCGDEAGQVGDSFSQSLDDRKREWSVQDCLHRHKHATGLVLR
jgi:hypothetical protein